MYFCLFTYSEKGSLGKVKCRYINTILVECFWNAYRLLTYDICVFCFLFQLYIIPVVASQFLVYIGALGGEELDFVWPKISPEMPEMLHVWNSFLDINTINLSDPFR